MYRCMDLCRAAMQSSVKELVCASFRVGLRLHVLLVGVIRCLWDSKFKYSCLN